MKKLLLALTVCMMVMTTTAFAEETQEAQEIHETAFQIGFITPLGTNGTDSHLTINTISLNFLGGYSYGNTGLEFGGLYNINTHITKGFQFAGISNYSGNAENAFQFAGIANIAAKGTVSSQFAGILNTASTVKGVQASGVANITTNDVDGMQFAGVSNMASTVKGAQVSGVVNISTNEVSSQFGAVLNIAKKVTGVQIGLFNYADEVDGVSIGLVNIVKNGGKQEFELAFSEILNTTLSFKFGTDRFYTILSGGVKYIPTSEVEYAYGLGFGTHIDWVQGWGNQIEIQTYNVTENGKAQKNFTTNLAQLKFTVSKEFAKHLKVFAGPVLNFNFDTNKNPKTGEFENSLAPWTMWETEFSGNKLNSWIGFSVGVRF